MPSNYLRIILIRAVALLIFFQQAGIAMLAAQTPDREVAAAARRVAAVAQLAAEEYALGVSGGRVVAAPEVEEARLFLAEARRNAVRLPPATSLPVVAMLTAMESMVGRTAEPDSVSRLVKALRLKLSEDLQLTLDEIPADPPSLSRGREIYQGTCAVCHGITGYGDGPQASVLSPRPANLADAASLRASSPLDFYRRITIGTAGTSMAPYEHLLSVEDRWAVAVYASTLRLPRPQGQVPAALRSFPASAPMSDAEVLAALPAGAGDANLAAVRTIQGPSGAATSAVFTTVRARVDSAYSLALAGRSEEARAMAMDAYIAFEQVERELRVQDPTLTLDLEEAFSSLRTRAGTGASPAQLAEIRLDLARALERAERTVGDRNSPSNVLVQSFIILLREGLEAILVIGALTAFLVKTGNGHRRREIHLGVGAAVAMSLLTALALETVFVVSRASQEGLEGGVMLAAMATLFYVSYWLVSKMEVAKWTRFVKSKVEKALSRRSALALASVAFLAVYREGFETVLFYKALAVSGGAGSWVPLLGGILIGAAVLAGVYVAINRFGVRLPLKPLFGVTGALLYYMAFVFAGKGVAELQEAGVVSLTPVTWSPRIPSMGIYPTVESLGLQGLLLLLAAVALAWTFLIEPRRFRVTPVLVPEGAPEAPDFPLRVPASAGQREMLRSIDRIEADLAEVRNELDRIRDQVAPERDVSSER
ncbi:MAG TPA: cytochrome c/FTR1 family iron permease [Gemmatimonadales bacterium]|nr:cytochrome c/FTR1 family iron permease [Gemmatimonadales bacterium]